MAKSDQRALDDQHGTTIVTLEGFCLPDRNVDSIHAVADARDDPGDDHLNFLEGRGLQDGADNHDPAADADTALSAQAIGSQESDDGAKETSNVVYGCYDTFKIGVWVFERVTEGFEANDGPENTLIIAEQLDGVGQLG